MSGNEPPSRYFTVLSHVTRHALTNCVFDALRPTTMHSPTFSVVPCGIVKLPVAYFCSIFQPDRSIVVGALTLIDVSASAPSVALIDPALRDEPAVNVNAAALTPPAKCTDDGPVPIPAGIVSATSTPAVGAGRESVTVKTCCWL